MRDCGWSLDEGVFGVSSCVEDGGDVGERRYQNGVEDGSQSEAKVRMC